MARSKTKQRRSSSHPRAFVDVVAPAPRAMSESELREMISEEIDKRIHIAPIDENAPGVTLSALPHRRHGGDRLHCAVRVLRADSRYIMILHRRSVRAKVNHLPYRGANARATTVAGMPPSRATARSRAGLIEQRTDGRSEYPPIAAPNAQRLRRAKTWAHSKPIARAIGGAV
jgi:hypothetical protein